MRSEVMWRLMLAGSISNTVAACVIVCSSFLGQQAGAQEVHVWRGTLTLPTYELGPPDPNPPFSLVNSRDVYPYPMLDNLTDKRVPKTYQALYLENRYLRITVLPQLGGHVYSIYDTINHREVLYRNDVIKYGLVGPRGAWVAGGMEFSFPYAHPMLTVSPIESMIHRYSDGGASVDIGAIDWVSGMYWEIALILRPNSARLQENVTLFNATPQQHLYLFWTNTAVKATDDLRYIYPMREVIKDDPFAPVQSWPTWDGVNHSWYKNIPSSMTIFGRDVHRDFFGVYYHQSDYGVVHVANFRQDPGKKIWSWGTARSGRIWDKLLSDNDGPYNEIQSGRFYTQGYREFIRPRRVEAWTEYWYPVSGLKDGFVDATRQIALNVDFPAVSDHGANATLRLSPVVAIRGAVLQVKQGNKLLMEVRGVNLRPLHTATYIVPVRDLQDAKRNLDVNVMQSTGQQILHWSASEPLDGNSDFVPRAGMPLRTEITNSPQTPTEALYLRGVFLQERGEMLGALRVYREVLRRDPLYIPALLQVAWYRYEGADFPEADRLIAQAEQRLQTDPRVQYAAGVIDRAEGHLNAAKDALWSVTHYGGPEAPALIELGEIEIRQRNFRKAEELLHRAMSFNSDDAFALADLSVAERMSGKLHDATSTVNRAVNKMPLLPYVIAEQIEDERRVSGGYADEQAVAAKWKGIVDSDPENVLAVAAWYHSLGAWQSADEILTAAQSNPSTAPIMPMLDYYLASDARYEGRAQKAKQYAQQAAQMRTIAVFPNRLEDAAVLSEELHANPGDPQAAYELGNFLFAHNRYDEAANLWTQALRANFDDPIIMRNLGLYEWRVKHHLATAAEDYVRAIRLSPDQYRYYTDLDEIYEEEGNIDARTKLFQEAPATVMDHDRVQARYALFLIEQRRYQDALTVLAEHSFVPWEGGVAIHNLFVSANMQLGKQELADRVPAEAEKYFRDAMQYPENLGTGEPARPYIAEQLYWLGNAYQAENEPAQAETVWRDAAKQRKDGADTCEVFPALALRKLGAQEAVQPLLQKCVDRAAQPGATAPELFEAGVAELNMQSRALAHRDFSRALATDPLYWEARIALNTTP